MFDSDIIAKVDKNPHRKIQNFDKANWDKMKVETQEFKQSFMDQYQNRSPDVKYKKLKSHLNNITDKYVPSKMSCSHFSPPWYNSTVKRMCNKKQRLYNKAKRSHKQKHWDAYSTHKWLHLFLCGSVFKKCSLHQTYPLLDIIPCLGLVYGMPSMQKGGGCH